MSDLVFEMIFHSTIATHQAIRIPLHYVVLRCDTSCDDVDDDGYASSAPASGAVAGTDCDDSDPATFKGAAPFDSITHCMRDEDGDGYGDNNSPGAELADHWPDDPTRNTAEVILTCEPENFQIDIAVDSSIRFECFVTNLIQNELTVRIEWKAINAIDTETCAKDSKW